MLERFLIRTTAHVVEREKEEGPLEVWDNSLAIRHPFRVCARDQSLDLQNDSIRIYLSVCLLRLLQVSLFLSLFLCLGGWRRPCISVVYM